MNENDERVVTYMTPSRKRELIAMSAPSSDPDDTGMFADALYCDGDDCSVVLNTNDDETFAELRCHALARLGWRGDGDLDYCPKCVGKGGDGA